MYFSLHNFKSFFLLDSELYQWHVEISNFESSGICIIDVQK